MMIVDTEDRSLNWFIFIPGLHQLVDPISGFNKSYNPRVLKYRELSTRLQKERLLNYLTRPQAKELEWPGSFLDEQARRAISCKLLSYPRTKTNLICDCVCDLHNDRFNGIDLKKDVYTLVFGHKISDYFLYE